MNLYYMKCLIFIKNKNIKLKREIDGKINLYSGCVGSDFKKFAISNEKEISDLLRKF